MAEKRRKKPGRKSLGKDAKDKVLQFRATHEEKEMIHAAAEAKGLTVSEWLHTLAVRAASRATKG